MNTRSTLLLAAGILAGALCSYYNVRSIRNLLTKSAVNPQRKDTVLNDCIAAYKRPDTPVRESITFILGEDKTNDNRYYEEASRYYANHPDGKTDYLVTTCRSLRASKLFEYYASVQHNNVIQSEHYLANSWMTCYPMNEKPLTNTLCNTLHDQYPDTNIDWHQALQQASPRWIGDSYHYTFEVTVKWIVPVNSLPDVSTSEKQISWLVSQKQIVDELSGTNISIDRFSWSFTTVYVNSGEDSKSPALLIKGYCTVLCVLQALTQHHNRMLLLQKPFTPALDSKQYYYATNDL